MVSSIDIITQIGTLQMRFNVSHYHLPFRGRACDSRPLYYFVSLSAIGKWLCSGSIGNTSFLAPLETEGEDYCRGVH